VQYDTLLRIRQLQEDLEAQGLAAARRDLDRAQRQRARLIERRNEVLETAGRRARENPVAEELRAFYEHERRLARLTDEKDADVAQFRDVAEEKRGQLEQAMKERRIVERLRERRIRAYEAEVRREDQKFSDETATNAAARSRSRARSGAPRKPNPSSAVRRQPGIRAPSYRKERAAP